MYECVQDVGVCFPASVYSVYIIVNIILGVAEGFTLLPGVSVTIVYRHLLFQRESLRALPFIIILSQ